MLGLMLIMASQPAVEVTPAFTSLTLSSSAGTCITHPLQPASITLNWTATNFVGASMDYKIYRDGVLITTQDTTSYGLQIAGLVENDTHNPQDITFNYRVDIVRSSDGVVLATSSVSSTKHYGTCS